MTPLRERIAGWLHRHDPRCWSFTWRGCTFGPGRWGGPHLRRRS